MIIQNLTDSDHYKFSMAQFVLRHFPSAWVKYRFKCRNIDTYGDGVVWTPEMVQEITEEVAHFCTLKFTAEEIYYLSQNKIFKPWFIDFLKIYKSNFQHIKIGLDSEGELAIEVEGPWFLTIHFEMPVLSIANEVYFRHTTKFEDICDSGDKRLLDKIEIAKREKFRFSEFGTRRRYSREWQEAIVSSLASSLPRDIFVGTSNVYLAMKYDLPVVGTMAHELVCSSQGMSDVSLADSQKYILKKWADYYPTLCTCLTDTLGTEKFLKDFDLSLARAYQGIRHDSGDAFKWAEIMINHYWSMGIDPKTKTFVFSDGLDFNKAAELNSAYGYLTNVMFGIGTNLTNDFEGVTPLQIVMKMVECNGRPVAKLSDNPGKTMCHDVGFLTYLRSVI